MSFTVFETRVRALLEEHPEMPATVLAERVGWDGSITWFRDNVRKLRPEHRRPGSTITDPAHVETARRLREQFQQPRPVHPVDDLTRDLADYDRAFGLTGEVA